MFGKLKRLALDAVLQAMVDPLLSRVSCSSKKLLVEEVADVLLLVHYHLMDRFLQAGRFYVSLIFSWESLMDKGHRPNKSSQVLHHLNVTLVQIILGELTVNQTQAPNGCLTVIQDVPLLVIASQPQQL